MAHVLLLGKLFLLEIEVLQYSVGLPERARNELHNSVLILKLVRDSVSEESITTLCVDEDILGLGDFLEHFI